MGEDLAASVDRIAAETAFSGVVRVDVDGSCVLERAYGASDRSHAIANSPDTQLGIASGSKALTALAVMSLVEDGVLTTDTTARSLLGDDVPLIGEDVTVEHLLGHRSGIGDFLDEEAPGEIIDYVMPVPVHELATTEDFVRVLDGHPTAFPAGSRFAYNNGGYVVLALLAERASGVPFHELVEERVCRPAGMADTAYLRSDELPGRAARGYLFAEGLRTNVLHLPVRGNGDGGVYTTVADVHALWDAFFGGRIVSPERVAEMVRPRSDAPEHAFRYGLGFWIHKTSDVVMLEGYDAGVSFRSMHDPAGPFTHTVIANWSDGAWPVGRHLRDAFERG